MNIRSFSVALAAAVLTLFGGVVTTSNAAAKTPTLSVAAASRAVDQARDALAGVGDTEVTLAMRDLAIALPSLEGSDREAARRILSRPADPSDSDPFTGPEAASSPDCTTNFCVHWTQVGADAPSLTDTSPSNGIPDYVDAAESHAENSFSVENNGLGWVEPKSDGTRGGGSGKTDIYLEQLGNQGLYGYAAPDRGQGSSRKQFAYLVIDQDFDPSEFGGAPAINSLEVTLAYEYNHVLQFNYDVFQDQWLFESTATWAEEEVYPAVNDYINYVPSFAAHPEVPLTNPGGLKIYGSAVWAHWLTSQINAAVVRKAWETSTATNPPDFAYASYDAAIKASSASDLPQQFVNFAAETAEWRASSAFPDPTTYPNIARAGTLGLSAPHSRKIDHTAFRLFKVVPNGLAAIKLKARVPSGVRAGIALIGRIGSETGGTITRQIAFSRTGGNLTVALANPGAFSRITAVLVNADGKVAGFSGSDWVYKHDNVKFNFKLVH